MTPRNRPDSRPRSRWARFTRRIREILRKGQSLVPRIDTVRPVRIRVPVPKKR